MDRPMALQCVRPDMNCEQQARRIDEVPNDDRRRKRQRPRRLRVARKGIRKRPHQQCEGRRVMERPTVMIDHLVERIAAPDSPTAAKEDLHVALPKANNLRHDHRKKQQRESANEHYGEPPASAGSRYRAEREDAVAHQGSVRRSSWLCNRCNPHSVGTQRQWHGHMSLRGS
jgi:hypothetical protein